jgi:hypothetical protein
MGLEKRGVFFPGRGGEHGSRFNRGNGSVRAHSGVGWGLGHVPAAEGAGTGAVSGIVVRGATGRCAGDCAELCGGRVGHDRNEQFRRHRPETGPLRSGGSGGGTERSGGAALARGRGRRPLGDRVGGAVGCGVDDGRGARGGRVCVFPRASRGAGPRRSGRDLCRDDERAGRGGPGRPGGARAYGVRGTLYLHVREDGEGRVPHDDGGDAGPGGPGDGRGGRAGNRKRMQAKGSAG